MPVMETETVRATHTIQSTGASIEIEHNGVSTGPVMLALACGNVMTLSGLSTPVISMQLRGYEGSR